MTNIDLYTFPAYLRGRSPMPYVKELTGDTGVWMGHKIDDSSNVRFTPAYVQFECDNMLMMMDREPIDRDDVTALIYMSMKPTDYAAHRWGLESLEAREALRAQDACVGKLIQKLNARAGEGNYVVTITADHGMMPMPEVTGGHRLSLRALLEMIDKKFGAKIGLGGGFINLWFDQVKMKELGITHEDVAAYLRSLTAGDYYGPREKWPAYLAYRPDEHLFFNAYTFEQVEAFVKANPSRWMANPYAGPGTAVTLDDDLQRLHATGTGIGYLAYGAHSDGQVPRREDTGYFFRDGLALTEEHETFEELKRRGTPRRSRAARSAGPRRSLLPPPFEDHEPYIGARRVVERFSAPAIHRLLSRHDVHDAHSREGSLILLEPGEDRLVGARLDEPRS